MTKPRDPGSLHRQLVSWTRNQIEGAGLHGAIFGLSGGIDSAVVCGLAAEAVGADRCLGLLLPIESADDDLRLGREVADRFGVETLELRLDPAFVVLLEEFETVRERAQRLAGDRVDAGSMTAPIVTENIEALARANLKPRLRMLSLYYFANLLGYMVLGTGNKAEFTVGYFTKGGDGVADALPLGDLVKAEVRMLARDLGVPDEVVTRPPTAGLWPEQTDEAELGMRYDQIDRFLHTGSSGDAAVDAEIERRQALSVHKIRTPPIPRPE